MSDSGFRRTAATISPREGFERALVWALRSANPKLAAEDIDALAARVADRLELWMLAALGPSPDWEADIPTRPEIPALKGAR